MAQRYGAFSKESTAGAPTAPGTVDEVVSFGALDDEGRALTWLPANALENVHVMHAGTSADADGNIIVSGGRVLAVVGLGDDLAAARKAAYAGVAEISWDGAQSRTDIALKAERGEIVVAKQSK